MTILVFKASNIKYSTHFNNFIKYLGFVHGFESDDDIYFVPESRIKCFKLNGCTITVDIGDREFKFEFRKLEFADDFIKSMK